MHAIKEPLASFLLLSILQDDIQGSQINVTSILCFCFTMTIQCMAMGCSWRSNRTAFTPKQKCCTSRELQNWWRNLSDCWWEKMLIASSQIKAKNRMRSSGQRLRSDFTNQQKQGFLHNGLNLKCFASVSGSTAISYATAKHTLSAGDPFDSDSYLILIDNCCSACITNEIKDFNCKPVKVNANINGVGGAIKLTHKGTIKWSFQDDQGGDPIPFRSGIHSMLPMHHVGYCLHNIGVKTPLVMPMVRVPGQQPTLTRLNYTGQTMHIIGQLPLIQQPT